MKLRYLLITISLLMAMTLIACAAEPETVTVVETVEVEKEVKVVETVEVLATVEVEKEVEVVVTATAEPVEEATSSRIGDDGSKQLIINEVFWPNSGYAIETDDALPLSRWGVAETLVKIDFDGQMIPYLAESWTQTDETTWSFTLRSDVTFQNGEPLNAEAVVTAFNHLLSAETPLRGLSPENIVSIEAVDEMTLTISTVEPDVLMPNRLSAPSFAILAPSAYESDPTTPFGTGTGPFILAEDVPEQSVTLVKNEAYWGGPVNLDEVLVLAAPDGDIRATMLQTGEVDIARHIPIPQIPLLETDPTLTLVRTAQPRTRTLYLNNVQGPLSDVQVRRAILHAIDKQAIVDAILEGVGSVAAGPFAPSEAWVNSDLSADTFDPDLARQLLTEAGYEEGELEIQIATYPSRAALPPSAVAIQQMLSDVGIAADVRIAPYNALEPEVLAANFDIFIASRSHLLDNYDPEGFLHADFSCEGSYNLSHYCNEEVDQLLAEARSTADSDARFELYRQIQTIIVEQDVANVFLNYTEQIYGYREGVLNYQPHPLEYYGLTPELDIE